MWRGHGIGLPVRDLIDRIAYQAAHDFGVGRLTGSDFDDMALNNGWFVNLSGYRYQIVPWIDMFGRDAIPSSVFEKRVRTRHNAARAMDELFGLDPEFLPKRQFVSNPSCNQSRFRAVRIRYLISSPLYLKPMRRLV